MGKADNNYNGEERRNDERRESRDRRGIVRFEDVLGRRSGVERRLGTAINSSHAARQGYQQ